MQRISSNMTTNDLNYHLRNQEVRMNQTENQMGNQQRVQNLRDDPVAAAHSTRYLSWMNRLDQFDRNTTQLQDSLRITEGHMSKAQDILQRINELTVQGANGTYSAQDLKYMGTEVNELLNELISIGNAKGPDGQSLFAGDRIDTKAFRTIQGRIDGHDGQVITSVEYMGSRGENKTEIGENAFITANFPGNKVFWADQQQVHSAVDSQTYQVPADTSIHVDGQEIKLRAGDNVQSIVAKINSAPVAVKASLDPVTNGLSLQTNQPHQIWMEDSPGSTVLRDLGLISDRAGLKPPHNIAPEARSFGGSIFDAVIKLRDNMMDGNKEYMGGQGLASVQASLKNLQTNIAELGARDERLDVTSKALEDEAPKVTEKNSHLMDLDVTEGITRLKMLDYTHQATMRAAGRILPPTLMDFLR